MARLLRSRAKLRTIENPSIEAYRQHLKDGTIDYHIVVQRESEKARRSLRDKARSEAVKRLDRRKNASNQNNRKKSFVANRSSVASY